MLFLPLLLHDFLKFSNLIFHIALLFLIPGSKLIGLLPLPCVIFFCPSWTANVMMRVSLGLTRHCDQILVDLFYLELLHHRRVRHQHPHPRSRQLLPLPRLLIQLALPPTHRILLHMAHSHFLLQKNFLGTSQPSELFYGANRPPSVLQGLHLRKSKKRTADYGN